MLVLGNDFFQGKNFTYDFREMRLITHPEQKPPNEYDKLGRPKGPQSVLIQWPSNQRLTEEALISLHNRLENLAKEEVEHPARALVSKETYTCGFMWLNRPELTRDERQRYAIIISREFRASTGKLAELIRKGPVANRLSNIPPPVPADTDPKATESPILKPVIQRSIVQEPVELKTPGMKTVGFNGSGIDGPWRWLNCRKVSLHMQKVPPVDKWGINRSLASRNLVRVRNRGQGDCLFLAIADQLYGNEERHEGLRQRCAEFYRNKPKLLSCFPEYEDPDLPRPDLQPQKVKVWAATTIAKRIENMGKPGVEGGLDSLVAIVNLFKSHCYIHRPDTGTYNVIEPIGEEDWSEKPQIHVVLTHSPLGTGHYESLRFLADPEEEDPRKQPRARYYEEGYSGGVYLRDDTPFGTRGLERTKEQRQAAKELMDREKRYDHYRCLADRDLTDEELVYGDSVHSAIIRNERLRWGLDQYDRNIDYTVPPQPEWAIRSEYKTIRDDSQSKLDESGFVEQQLQPPQSIGVTDESDEEWSLKPSRLKLFKKKRWVPRRPKLRKGMKPPAEFITFTDIEVELPSKDENSEVEMIPETPVKKTFTKVKFFDGEESEVTEAAKAVRDELERQIEWWDRAFADKRVTDPGSDSDPRTLLQTLAPANTECTFDIAPWSFKQVMLQVPIAFRVPDGPYWFRADNRMWPPARQEEPPDICGVKEPELPWNKWLTIDQDAEVRGQRFSIRLTNDTPHRRRLPVGMMMGWIKPGKTSAVFDEDLNDPLSPVHAYDRFMDSLIENQTYEFCPNIDDKLPLFRKSFEKLVRDPVRQSWIEGSGVAEDLEKPEPPLLPPEESKSGPVWEYFLEQLDQIEWDKNAPPEKVSKCKDMLWRLNKVFPQKDHVFELGSAVPWNHEINELPNSKPVSFPPVKASAERKARLREFVSEQLAAGVIRPSNSPYAAPAHIVPKKGNPQGRFVVNYKALNTQTRKDRYPLPRIDDIMNSVGSATRFCTLDLLAGYNQIPIRPDHIEKTAFIVPDGLFEYVRMPFGLCNAPATFQRAMDDTLSGLKWNICLVYLDDVVAFGKDDDQAIERLQIVLQALIRKGFVIKPKKCQMLMQQMSFLGHMVSEDGIRADPAKTRAIGEMPAPRTKTQLLRFLGMANFYRQFVMGFALKAQPLHALLKGDAKWKWGPEEQEAFESIRMALATDGVITHFDPDKPSYIHVDACVTGIGALLLQDEKIVACASRSLNIHESRYSVTELEGLAVKYAMDQFRHYIEGTRVIVYTDHKALVPMMRRNARESNSKRINRWMEGTLADADFDIRYKKGSSNEDADALSRNPVDPAPVVEVYEDEVPEIGTIQIKFPEPETVTGYDLTGNQHLCEVPWQVRVWKQAHANHLLESRELEWQWFLRQIGKKSHPMDLLLSRPVTIFEDPPQWLPEGYWRGKVNEFYQDQAKDELVWMMHDGTPLPLIPATTTVKLQFSTAATPAAYGITKTILKKPVNPEPVIGKAKVAKPLVLPKESEFQEIDGPVSMLESMSSKHESLGGDPVEAITEELRRVLRHLVNLAGVKHVTTTAYHPQANANAERRMGIIKAALAKQTNENRRDWDRFLDPTVFAYNTAVHATTQQTPQLLWYGREARTPLDARALETSFQYYEKIPDLLREITRTLAAVQEDAHAGVEILHRKHQDQLDPKRRGVTYKVGDLVMIHKQARTGGGRSALDSAYEGPYVIAGIPKTNVFKIRNPLSDNPGRTFNVERLKPFYSRTELYQSPDVFGELTLHKDFAPGGKKEKLLPIPPDMSKKDVEMEEEGMKELTKKAQKEIKINRQLRQPTTIEPDCREELPRAKSGRKRYRPISWDDFTHRNHWSPSHIDQRSKFGATQLPKGFAKSVQWEEQQCANAQDDFAYHYGQFDPCDLQGVADIMLNFEHIHSVSLNRIEKFWKLFRNLMKIQILHRRVLLILSRRQPDERGKQRSYD
ncbi:Retrovirus-related Pol polyprotein from transposon 17.6 [Hypsibius exemplaris]|uniref:RNA-directed DNA polymerase n=1 Tax=Hypsibius exemplaris TaxID=2072580 RepID=A0A9X6NQ37_HYPEX|nr:Retrovirus-related Pol polyprotein from transposon 17.6 [Hypsibius exemplaris]